MKKNKNKWSRNTDVTKAFARVAQDLILIAEDVDRARNLAYMAVLAWNISLYPKNQIPEKIELIAQEYEKNNPGVIQAELLAKDFELLISKKLKQCPGIKRTITKIGVEDNGEQYVITTESVPFVLQ